MANQPFLTEFKGDYLSAVATEKITFQKIFRQNLLEAGQNPVRTVEIPFVHTPIALMYPSLLSYQIIHLSHKDLGRLR